MTLLRALGLIAFPVTCALAIDQLVAYCEALFVSRNVRRRNQSHVFLPPRRGESLPRRRGHLLRRAA